MPNQQELITRSERDVYKSFTEKFSGNWLQGRLAFAIFEERKMEWENHFHMQNERYPNNNEIDAWYLDQPHEEILNALVGAESRINQFLSERIDEEVNMYKEQLKEEHLYKYLFSLSESVKSLKPSWLKDITLGLIVNILYTVLVIIFALIVYMNPSIIDFVKELFSRG